MKTPLQVEYRAMQALEALAAGKPLSQCDFHCASFATWPGPPRKAARLLAAHANASRGRDVLWLIGAETCRREAGLAARPWSIGADTARFDTWLDAVLPWFDGLVPGVQAFAIPAGPVEKARHKTVVALLIETGRVPFVIRKAGKAETLEVPWWGAEAGRVHSAGRQDLIRLLVPLQDLPQFEVLEAELTFYKNPHASGASKAAYRWTLDGSLYVIPPSAEARTVIPLHRCRSSILISGSAFRAVAQDVNLTADKQSPAVRITDSAALIEGLGRVFVYCSGSTPAGEVPWQKPLTVTFDLPPAGMDRAAVAVCSLLPAATTESIQAGRWKL